MEEIEKKASELYLSNNIHWKKKSNISDAFNPTSNKTYASSNVQMRQLWKKNEKVKKGNRIFTFKKKKKK